MTSPQRSYIICANQRSGSTMLSRLLADTGVAGRPEEYFLAVDEVAMPDFLCWEHGPHATPGMTRSQYLEAVYQQGTTPNGVFAAKLMWNVIGYMVEKFNSLHHFAGKNTVDTFRAAFPNPQAIVLTRKDKLAQAVSWARADQEGVWVVDQGSALPSPPASLHYDPELIGNLMRLIEVGEREWRVLLGQLGVQPLEMTYEDLVADPGAAIGLALEHLGLGLPEGHTVAVRTQQQADDVNQEWIDRYRSGDTTA